MKMKKMFISTAVCSLLFPTFLLPAASAKASEVNIYTESSFSPEEIIAKENESGNFIKNDLYLDFEKEIVQLLANNEKSIATHRAENSTNTAEDLLYLLEKYEGAEVTIMSSNITHQLVSGGVNSFATTKSAMINLANTYDNNANILLVGGTIVGFPLGIFGALLVALSYGALSSKFTTAANLMRQWYSSSSSRGGVRITLTDTFAISSARSISKATIR